MSRRSFNIKAEAGFTLVEVLITLAIFAIGILAVASLQVSANVQSRKSAEITEASGIASDQMENLLQRPFDHADLDPALNPHQLASGKYLLQWSVAASDLNGDGINDSKSVNLTVSWNAMFHAGSSQRLVRMVFLKHDR
jgi:type IV pilus assembly protein PilV